MPSSKVISFARWGLAALLAAGMAGCGGGDSGSSTTTTTTTPPPITPTGTPVATAAAANPAGTNTANNPAQAFTLVQGSGATVVAVNSPPVVNFTVVDKTGHVVKGLTTSNVSFAIAKLVPGSNGTPDQWVNYIYRTEAGTAGVGPGGVVQAPNSKQATTDTKTATQLVYNDAGGYYTYTFSTDIKDPTKTNGVTYEPSRTHRIAIQLSYTDSDGATVLVNPSYDFTIGTDGKSTAVTDPTKTRKMVDLASCNECHGLLAVHGGGRVDTQYCVMCHNAGTTDANSGNNLDFRSMVHKIHMGVHLLNGYTIWGFQDSKNDFSDVAFPQDVRNCTKCHDGSSTAAHKTPQGDNWKNVPSRAACGACHDGINFATGGGTALATTFPGHIGGAQSDDSNCALCHKPADIAVYHIPVTPPYPGNSFDVSGAAGNANSNAAWIASNDANLPAGAIKVSYDLQSVTVDANNHLVMKFRMLQNGTATLFNTFGAKTQLWDNFIGSPSAYFVWSVPQDGIAAPADFNASASCYLKNAWNGTATTGTGACTLSAPDASGYYTVTLTGVIIPANANMLTGGLGYTYSLSGTQPLTQTNVTGYPLKACGVAANGNNCGGLIVPAPDVKMVATGYTGRRIIVDNAKCNLCHEKLGEFTDEAFHAGQRNDGESCAWCHKPTQTSSGWSADSTNFVHAIHAASKRTVPFIWHATSSADNFSTIGFPGDLKKCETCHRPGTYDFSAAASASAVPNRLYRYVATGTFTSATAVSNSPYITLGTNYGTGFTYNAATGLVTAQAADTTLVNSPIATACFSCHDGNMAAQPGLKVKDHIEQMGVGSIYEPRSTALARSEQCLLCHGPTSTIAPIKAAHGQ